MQHIDSTSPVKRSDALAKQIIYELKKKGYPESDQTLNVLGLKIENDIRRMQAGTRSDVSYSELGVKDVRRDTAVTCFFGLLDNLAIYPDKTIAEAAQAIMKKVGHLRGTQKRDYALESSDITTLLETLKEAEMATAVAAIPLLGALITELTAAQADFDRAADAYYDFDTARKKGEIEYVSRVNRDMIADINALADYLTLMARIDSDSYKQLADRIENRIDRQNRNIAAIRAHKALPFPDDEAETGTQTGDEPGGTTPGGEDSGTEPDKPGQGGQGPDGSDDDSMPSA